MSIYILSDKKVDGAINLPVFEINFIKQNIDFNTYDALIFTSKNALYSLEHHNENWKTIPSYAIAPMTADIIKELNGNLVFTGVTNHGDQFALEIQEKLKGKKVLYLRGSKVVSNLIDTLQCDAQIVYESICKKNNQNLKPPKNSIIIFSSPSTIKCFLDNFDWDDSYKAISIGKTTAKYFPKYIDFTISDTTSLKSCVEKAKELL
ncbi:MAG: uroporphyrinogen-III synthase [Epsilonproteobacteria bacterium]|nr:MAG: uroporphyrinogen-III synthase [Campylobacterota bacterium]